MGSPFDNKGAPPSVGLTSPSNLSRTPHLSGGIDSQQGSAFSNQTSPMKPIKSRKGLYTILGVIAVIILIPFLLVGLLMFLFMIESEGMEGNSSFSSLKVLEINDGDNLVFYGYSYYSHSENENVGELRMFNISQNGTLGSSYTLYQEGEWLEVVGVYMDEKGPMVICKIDWMRVEVFLLDDWSSAESTYPKLVKQKFRNLPEEIDWDSQLISTEEGAWLLFEGHDGNTFIGSYDLIEDSLQKRYVEDGGGLWLATVGIWDGQEVGVLRGHQAGSEEPVTLLCPPNDWENGCFSPEWGDEWETSFLYSNGDVLLYRWNETGGGWDMECSYWKNQSYESVEDPLLIGWLGCSDSQSEQGDGDISNQHKLWLNPMGGEIQFIQSPPSLDAENMYVEWVELVKIENDDTVEIWCTYDDLSGNESLWLRFPSGELRFLVE